MLLAESDGMKHDASVTLTSQVAMAVKHAALTTFTDPALENLLPVLHTSMAGAHTSKSATKGDSCMAGEASTYLATVIQAKTKIDAALKKDKIGSKGDRVALKQSLELYVGVFSTTGNPVDGYNKKLDKRVPEDVHHKMVEGERTSATLKMLVEKVAPYLNGVPVFIERDAKAFAQYQEIVVQRLHVSKGVPAPTTALTDGATLMAAAQMDAALDVLGNSTQSFGMAPMGGLAANGAVGMPAPTPDGLGDMLGPLLAWGAPAPALASLSTPPFVAVAASARGVPLQPLQPRSGAFGGSGFDGSHRHFIFQQWGQQQWGQQPQWSRYQQRVYRYFFFAPKQRRTEWIEWWQC